MPILDIPSHEYHDLKAVSAGMVWDMDNSCPLKAWAASPWNPTRPIPRAKHFDIGSAVHLAVLEPHDLADRVSIVDALDYRTKAAKEARDSAYAENRIPILQSEYSQILDLAEAIQRHPMAKGLFTAGSAERSLVWEWRGIPCKCRPDYLADDRSFIVDLKTAVSAHPKEIARKALLEGWHVRASWYLPGVREVTGELPEKYLFVVIEKEFPHIVEVYELDTKALIYGEQIVGRSMRRLTWCFKTNEWPSYGEGGISDLELPSWSEFERARREELGEFDE